MNMYSLLVKKISSLVLNFGEEIELFFDRVTFWPPCAYSETHILFFGTIEMKHAHNRKRGSCAETV